MLPFLLFSLIIILLIESKRLDNLSIFLFICSCLFCSSFSLLHPLIVVIPENINATIEKNIGTEFLKKVLK